MSNVELYEHQKTALNFIKDKKSFALFMEMGTGKSKIIVHHSYNLLCSGKVNCVLIISPNAVKRQWVYDQFPAHYPDDNKSFDFSLWTGATTKTFDYSFHNSLSKKNNLFIFSCNVEAFQSSKIDEYIKNILAERKCFIVIDESAKIKNGRRKPIKGHRAGAIRTNKILDLFSSVEHKAILSGTPTPNSPFDLWSQYEFLSKNFFGLDYYFFTLEYGILIAHTNFQGKKYNALLTEQEFLFVKRQLLRYPELTPSAIEAVALKNGLRVKDVFAINSMKKFSGFKNLDKLKSKMQEITFFVSKKDCLDLPDKIYSVLYSEMGPLQTRVYKELEKNLYTEYQGKELNVANKLILALRLQMVTGGLFPFSKSAELLGAQSAKQYGTLPIPDSGKISCILDDLEGVPDETSIIIWARFRIEIETIKTALTSHGYTADIYYGGSAPEIITDFQDKKFRILVASTQKGGEGLNLQVATLHYFFSNSFRADSRLQAEDRSHRIGQKNNVLYKDIICPGTIDDHIYSVLKRKEDLINYFRNKSITDILK